MIEPGVDAMPTGRDGAVEGVIIDRNILIRLAAACRIEPAAPQLLMPDAPVPAPQAAR